MTSPTDPSATPRPIAADLYSGAGGSGTGLHRAGFRVIGFDNHPQPNYPFEHHVVDLTMVDIAELCHRVGAVVAGGSPPCQRFSDLAKRNGNAEDWPDLIDHTRQGLERSGLPWFIENVEGAPLRDPVVLCGTTFPELRVIRHRLFEAGGGLVIPPRPCGRHPLVFTHDKRKAHYGRLDQDTSFVQVTGGGNATVANKAAAMGIDWMTGKELNEAVPPCYAEWVGRALMSSLTKGEVAA